MKLHTEEHELGLPFFYLGGGILASNTIGTELEVGLSTLNVLVVGIVQMTIDDLLSEGHRGAQSVVGSQSQMPKTSVEKRLIRK